MDQAGGFGASELDASNGLSGMEEGEWIGQKAAPLATQVLEGLEAPPQVNEEMQR